jgi:hypothetical protein
MVPSQEGKMATSSHKSADNHPEGLLNRIAKDIVAVYDWLSGPPMSEQDRVNRALAETRPLRDKNIGIML